MLRWRGFGVAVDTSTSTGFAVASKDNKNSVSRHYKQPKFTYSANVNNSATAVKRRRNIFLPVRVSLFVGPRTWVVTVVSQRFVLVARAENYVFSSFGVA